MNSKNPFILHVVLNILTGITVAFLSSLLIYFKQKEYLHLAVILFSVFVIFFFSKKIENSINHYSAQFKSVGIIAILLISFLGPQFIYQIRPYTFYISGFAIGSIVILSISSNLVSKRKSSIALNNFGVFLVFFIVGYIIPWEILQYIIPGLSILLVVLLLFVFDFKPLVKILLISTLLICAIIFITFSKPINYFDEQSSYEDKVLFASETQFHKVVITQWHNDHWIYIDKLKNISSIDEYLFYEPMAHSLFKINDKINDVLIIGGENGCLIREVLKHQGIKRIEVISYDTLLRNLGMKERYFTEMNQGAYQHKKVHLLHEDLIQYVSNTNKSYDAIFIDLPDPRNIETNQYYTLEFYQLVKKILKANGLMITQAGSPYFATQAFYSIEKTIKQSGFKTLPIHNQILTLGEWGWYICSVELEKDKMKERLIGNDSFEVETKWFNEEAAMLVSAFGKTYSDTMQVGINTLENPLLYQYYLKGNWDLN